MSRNDLSKYLDFTTETAYLAGKLTLQYFQRHMHTDFKADTSPVTTADYKSEELIRSRIEGRFPGHEVVGEELGRNANPGASHRWIIDPIDGTKSFMRGVPLYAILIALEIDGNIEVGAAYFPALDEMIAAATSLGCWWNGRPARVSTVSKLKRGIVTCTSTQNFLKYGRLQEWKHFLKTCYFQAGWGDAYGYLLVATGRAELMLDPDMNFWDCAPFPPILREAGGYFGDWQGQATIYGEEALATSQILLPEVLGAIQQITRGRSLESQIHP
jgi:myo-inositol-1(or 4)-monophosphatase